MCKNTKNHPNYNMIIEKLTQPGTYLNSGDLTPNQKKLLWEVMKRHGASQGFAYDRYFKEGFQKWELIGINSIKRQFIVEHYTELFGDSVPALSAGVPTSDNIVDVIIQNDGEFYRTLGRVFGLKKVFTDHMGTLGMGSNSVLNKFSADDWKDYERIGVLAVMQEFEREVIDLGGEEIR